MTVFMFHIDCVTLCWNSETQKHRVGFILTFGADFLPADRS